MIKKFKFFYVLLLFIFINNDLYSFDKKGNASFISEIKTGVVAHDIGLFGRQKEEGLDSTFEFLFRKIDYNLLNNIECNMIQIINNIDNMKKIPKEN